MQPIRFYIIVLGVFLAALIVGALFFISGMSGASYLVSDGVGYGMHYLDKPSYDSHLQGLIFTLSFLAAGILLFLLVLLPDRRGAFAQPQAALPPQPRRRPAAPAPQAAPATQAAPAPQAAPATQAAPAPQAEPEAPAEGEEPPAESPPTAEIEASGDAVNGAPVTQPPSAETGRSVDEEVLTSNEPGKFDIEDLPDPRFDDSGDEDVVYGNGRVTDDSIWDFIHDYPDSAVKFLYRKTLENKNLSPNEEDIYRKWEMRGMSRAKVREYVLEIMGWKSLPDDFPHNIWRELRDQIFEFKSKVT